MSQKRLDGIRVAALVADGFEQVELTEPMKALQDAGARVLIVSPSGDRVRAWKDGQWGDEFQVDVPMEHALAVIDRAILGQWRSPKWGQSCSAELGQ